MSTGLLMDRSVLGAPSQAASPLAAPAASPGWCVVPRCRIHFEKCDGGCKIYCHCDDATATATVQNLCKMLAGGLCSCCCTWNGMAVCTVNLCCGNCTCEATKDGCCITCTSGDDKCCEMLQACCDTLAACCESGCCCYVCFNNTPCCCGTSKS